MTRGRVRCSELAHLAHTLAEKPPEDDEDTDAQDERLDQVPDVGNVTDSSVDFGGNRGQGVAHHGKHGEQETQERFDVLVHLYEEFSPVPRSRFSAALSRHELDPRLSK